jgi:hypothetical protein
LLSAKPGIQHLQDAFRAVSMESYANVSNSLHLQVQSYKLYGQALQSIRLAIQNAATSTDITLMASIFLMQKREASLMPCQVVNNFLSTSRV